VMTTYCAARPKWRLTVMPSSVGIAIFMRTSRWVGRGG
jgi:hypothetical protein